MGPSARTSWSFLLGGENGLRSSRDITCWGDLMQKYTIILKTKTKKKNKQKQTKQTKQKTKTKKQNK